MDGIFLIRWKRLFIVIALIYFIIVICFTYILSHHHDGEIKYVYSNWSHELIKTISDDKNRSYSEAKAILFPDLSARKIVAILEIKVSNKIEQYHSHPEKFKTAENKTLYYKLNKINQSYELKLQKALDVPWKLILYAFLVYVIPLTCLYLFRVGMDWMIREFKNK